MAVSLVVSYLVTYYSVSEAKGFPINSMNLLHMSRIILFFSFWLPNTFLPIFREIIIRQSLTPLQKLESLDNGFVVYLAGDLGIPILNTEDKDRAKSSRD